MNIPTVAEVTWRLKYGKVQVTVYSPEAVQKCVRRARKCGYPSIEVREFVKVAGRILSNPATVIRLN